MDARQLRSFGWALYVCLAMCMLPLAAGAAPYAAMVIDARTGEVLHSRNADTRLHPASLTKMMTLYIAFDAVERGQISLDTKVTISRHAASEPPSKLGLRAGQKIALRYLIRAAAVKSANDASTAIAEALSGSEAAFARRMNHTAKALGMTRTTFKNAHGLTQSGHMSTARDMTILGRHLLYDFPQYYHLFARTQVHAGVKDVLNTNRRLLGSYRGADGIKTGYTNAAGYNLVASAERGRERVIATMFGGTSSRARNARVAELLDMGFRRAPSHASVRKPKVNKGLLAEAGTQSLGKTVRVSGIVKTSLRPPLRPGVDVARADTGVSSVDIDAALAVAQATALRPSDTAQPSAQPLAEPVIVPELRRSATEMVRAQIAPAAAAPVVVSRYSTSGGHLWGINVGRYPTRYKAEKVLMQTALIEMEALDSALRKVNASSGGFEANFHGLTREGAELACRRLQARNIGCFALGPG